MNIAEKNDSIWNDISGKDLFISNKLNQLSRFGNDSMKKGYYAARAKEVVKTLPHEVVVKIVKSTADALNENNGSYPQLIPPSNYIGKQNDDVNHNSNKIEDETVDSRLVKILATIQLLSADSNIEKVKTNAKNYKLYMESIVHQCVFFAEKTIDLLPTLNLLIDELFDWNNRTPDEKKEIFSAIVEKYSAFVDNLREFKQYIDEHNEIWTGALASCKQEIEKLAEKIFKSGPNIKMDDLEKLAVAIQSFIYKASDMLTLIMDELRKYNRIDKLTYLMALIAKLVDDDSKDQLEIAAELRDKLSRAAASDAEKKAKEYADQVRKAEQMQKTMGCIGKIFGWVVAAVGVVAAVFTGGASLIVAGIALGVTVSDEVYQDITGHSFIQDGLQQIMKPLMEVMSQCFTKLLSALGVKGEKKDLIGNILGAIAASVVFIAGIVVAGSFVAKVGGAVFQKIGEKFAEGIVEAESSATTARLLSNFARKMITEMFEKFQGGIGRAAGLSEEKAAQIANYSQMGGVASSLLNTGLQAGGDISVNIMRLDAEKRRAEMQKDLAIQEVIKEMFDIAVEHYRKQIASVNSIIENMSIMAENKYHADRFIVESINSTFA
ncbi:TPA: YopB/SseC family type III secretion system translocon subunit [Escherichia coli]|nr:YopB/SseC family type III secretion system translocon subunit [Escherichia coli]HBA9523019.1 YopB/SseC family type III secretion system translocon subunit [Escherichia coli]HBA9550983.1 YopB/SseC family type III secretion system translocon subunit [Escherichia coli]HBA9560442.1 YopB/SseC family type III secretion system translocon subunit [Escherichia coli]